MNENNKIEQANNNIKKLINKLVEYEYKRLQCCPYSHNMNRLKTKEDYIKCDDCHVCKLTYLEKFKKELEEEYLIE